MESLEHRWLDRWTVELQGGRLIDASVGDHAGDSDGCQNFKQANNRTVNKLQSEPEEQKSFLDDVHVRYHASV